MPEIRAIENNIVNLDRILVIKLNLLGDTLEFLPTLAGIRAAHPSAHVTAFVTQIGAEIVQRTGCVDSLWTATLSEARAAAAVLRWARRMRDGTYNAVVFSSDTTSLMILAAFLARIPRRVGFSSPCFHRLLTDRITYRPDMLHCELNYELARALGADSDPEPARLAAYPEDRVTLASTLREHGIGERVRLLILHPGSNRPSRRWPLNRFTELLDHLHDEVPALQPVLIGTIEERDLAQRIAAGCCSARPVNLTGATTVGHLIALFQRDAIFMGHSTGPLHLAYALGTPSISLWGAASPVIWGPMFHRTRHCLLHADVKCIFCEQAECPTNVECMSAIPVHRVVEAVREAAGKRLLESGD